MKRRANKNDFTEENLPHNRKEQLLDIIKVRYRTLLNIGLILFIFLIPYMFSTLAKTLYEISIYEQYEPEEAIQLIRTNALIFGGINIICLVIFAIGLSGVMKIVKRLCFYDPVFFKEDFKAGIKDNSGFMIGLFIILGIKSNFIFKTSS